MSEFLQENWLYISSAIAVVGLLIGIMVKIYKIDTWVGAINTEINTLKKGLKTVQEDIKKLFERLPPQKTADASSPLNLTDFGRKISDHVDAKEWANNNAEKLMEQARGKEEFEIFSICSEHVEKTFDEENEFNRTVQSTAYNYGTDTEQVLMVYRIELRDRILANIDN